MGLTASLLIFHPKALANSSKSLGKLYSLHAFVMQFLPPEILFPLSRPLGLTDLLRKALPVAPG